MAKRRYVPDRGDIVWLHFTPQAGHEQAGHRPALVLSPATYNRRSGLMLCCPMTSKRKGYPFEVVLIDEADQEGVVLADQVKSLDLVSRHFRFPSWQSLGASIAYVSRFHRRLFVIRSDGARILPRDRCRIRYPKAQDRVSHRIVCQVLQSYICLGKPPGQKGPARRRSGRHRQG